MNDFIESLKRLYLNNRIKIEKLNELLANKKITQVEYDYILGKEV